MSSTLLFLLSPYICIGLFAGMFYRIRSLLLMSSSSWIRRLRYDLINEMVALFCGIVLISLFIHIFSDLINVRVAAISVTMQWYFASLLILSIGLSCAVGASFVLHNQVYRASSTLLLAKRLGEDTLTLSFFRYIFIFFISIIYYLPVFFVSRYFVLWSWKLQVGLLILMAMTTLSLYSLLRLQLWSPYKSSKASYDYVSLISKNAKYKPTKLLFALYCWRLRQLLYYNSMSRTWIYLGIITLIITVMLKNLTSTPEILLMVASFITGSITATALSFASAFDIKFTAWWERMIGISHQEYLYSIKYISWSLALVLGTVVVVSFLLSSSAIDFALKCAFIAALPCWLVPYVVFQIDASKALITSLSTFLIGMFLATALIASWLSLLLCPLIAYYGNISQEGRYYRA